jgi:hypothetical protein
MMRRGGSVIRPLTIAGWLVACGDDDPIRDDGGSTPEATPAADQARYVGCAVDVTIDPDGHEYGSYREYDDHGWIALHEDDYDLDGVPEQRETWVSDVWGNVLEYARDVGADGAVDHAIHGQYDADGNPVRVEEDRLGDGSDVSTYTSTDGRVRTREWDAGADGTIEQIDTYTYDARDRLTRITATDPEDGGVDSVQRWTWHGDTDLVATWVLDVRFDDGTLSESASSTWDYDDQERLVHATSHQDGLRSERDSVYDGDAPEPSSAHVVETEAGVADREMDYTWTWDDEWRLLDEVWAVEGREQQHQVWVWTCP